MKLISSLVSSKRTLFISYWDRLLTIPFKLTVQTQTFLNLFLGTGYQRVCFLLLLHITTLMVGDFYISDEHQHLAYSPGGLFVVPNNAGQHNLTRGRRQGTAGKRTLNFLSWRGEDSKQRGN